MNNKSIHKWILSGFTIILLATLLALAVVNASSVLAQIDSFLSSSEPGYTPIQPASVHIIGDDPDENGYTGPVPEQTNNGMPSGEGAVDEAFWGANFTEPQPDMNSYQQGINQEILAFDYIFAAGSTLKTRNSGLRWANDGSGGCTYATSGSPSTVLNLDLQLPQGSRIDYLRIFYYDTAVSADSTAWVTMYDGEGGLVDLTYVTSTGSAGYGTNLSALVDHIVDNEQNTYVLNWRPNVLGDTMRLCGLRVAYTILP